MSKKRTHRNTPAPTGSHQVAPAAKAAPAAKETPCAHPANKHAQAAGMAHPSLPALSSLTHVPAFQDLTPSAEQNQAFEAYVATFGSQANPQAEPCVNGVSSDTPSSVRLDVHSDVHSDVLSDELYLACVVRLDRGFPALAYAGGLVRAEFSASLSKAEDASKNLDVADAPTDARVGSMRSRGSKASVAKTGFSRQRGQKAKRAAKLQHARGTKKSDASGASGKCAVGDWVVLRLPAGHDMGVIEAILPRRSEFSRWRGGARGERQVLAANVDVVLIAQAVGEFGLSLNRIARSVVIARDLGAAPVVLLTKCDCVSAQELEGYVDTLHALLGEQMAVLCTSSAKAEGISAVEGQVGPGQVAIVLGESGAGKSTLLNALLGQDALETGAVRASDGAGRHTTVARRMVKLASGGIIVDEPGLRSLPLVGHEHGLALTFPAIAAQAELCKFRDCTHTTEPGCAVLEARAQGTIAAVQLEAWQALAAEMRNSSERLDPDVRL